MRIMIVFLAACSAWGQTQFVSGAVGDYATYPSSAATVSFSSGLQTLASLNASNIKAAVCGYVATASGATKTLQNLHVMIGSLTKTGGTDLRIGIQLPSTTTGPPIQPDGSWAAAGAAYATVSDASMTANTWLRSGTVGGTLSVTNGSKLCLVAEPENYGGSDSISIRGANVRVTYTSMATAYGGASWATVGTTFAMLHLLEFTDGTFGSIGIGAPLNAVGTSATLNTGTTPDEIALKVQPSVSMSVFGICSDNIYSTATGDFDWVLYDGTTPMVTVSNDVNQTFLTSSTSTMCSYFPTPQTLSSGGTYYAAIKPTTANNVQIRYNGVADAAYWAAYGGGAGTGYSTRTDAGSWSDTTTRRPTIWLLVGGVVDGSGVTGGAFVVTQ